jgi:metal-dependent HD superfamily phosphatase/phosphodiesterase
MTDAQSALETALRNSLSPKAADLSRVLLERTAGKVHALMEYLLGDETILAHQNFANTVTIRRLGFNDHGPVHARITTHNALKVLEFLRRGGVPSSLVAEEVGTFEDSQVAVALGCFLHDLGMGVTRESHEWHSCELADPFIRTALEKLYPGDLQMRCAIRTMCREIIVGHMATCRIHSVEAGVVLVADGTDMTRGRSRIPQMLSRDPAVGDIHRHSATAITRVDVLPGETKPVRIDIQMEDLTGTYQVEEVFMTKVKASPIMPHLEVCVLVKDQPPRFYLR